ncbi:MAG: TonB-dependent receptor [Bacteroidota bacterium]
MKHHFLSRLFLWICTGLFTSSLMAQGSFDQDTVTIQSARLSQNRFELGRQASIISAREIEALPVQTVDELLRYVSGVEIQSRGPFGAQADILMRGSTFSQVLMLVDGVRINDPLTGHFNGYLPVALAEISRIEVLRGPAAAIYGADAVGGVIHVVTKTFDPASTHQQSEFMGQLGVGEENLSTAQAGFYKKGPVLELGGGLTSNRTDGQLLPPDSLGVRSDLRNTTASVSARLRLGRNWKAMARVARDVRLFNARYFYTISSFDQSREQTEQTWAQVRIARQQGNQQSYLDAAFKVMSDSFLFNPAFPANVHTTQLGNLNFHHTQRINRQLELAGGLQYTYRNIVSTDRGDHQDSHFAAYLMGLFQPLRNLSLSASLRADLDENYGLEFLPQANLAYQLRNLTLRASSGRSIRAADYTERFIGFELPGVISPGRNLGNPELLAERAWSHEIGFDLLIGRALRISSTGFYRQGTNLIDYILTPGREYPQPEKVFPDSLYFITQNVSRLNTLGWETEVSFRRYWDDDWGIQLDAGLMWVANSVGLDLPSKYLANNAPFIFNTRAFIQLGNFSWSITALYKQRDAEQAVNIGVDLDPTYFLLNSQASYRLLPGLSLYGQVINATDAEYQDILGAYMPRRWFLGGIKWNFRRN